MLSLHIIQSIAKLQIILALILIFPQNSYSQNIEQLKEKYGQAITFYNTTSITEYTFSFDENTGQIVVKEEREDNVQHNSGSRYYTTKLYYNSFCDVSNKTLAGTWRKRNTHGQDGIFISDLEYLEYERYLKENQSFNFTYTKKYVDAKFLTIHYFLCEYPTLKYKVIFNIPENIDVNLVDFHFENTSIEKEVLTKRNGDRSVIYTQNNVVPITKESNLPSLGYFVPHILIQTKSAQFEGQKFICMETLNDQYNWYRSLVESTGDDNFDFTEESNKIVEGLTSDREKVRAIFNWVQENIAYIANEDGIAGFKPESSQQVYHLKYGDCKGMANLLKGMLRFLGYDARLAWVGTDRLYHDYSIPTLAADNHIICALELDGEWIYLDATSKYCKFGDIPHYLRGRQMLIENGKEYLIHFIEDGWDDMQSEHIYSLELNEDKLVGEVEMTQIGRFKESTLSLINVDNAEIQRILIGKSLSQGNENINIVCEIQPYGKNVPLSFSGNVNWINSISNFGDKFYVTFCPIRTYNFDDNERKYDYRTEGKGIEKIRVKIKIPEEYTIKSIPENIDISNDYYNIAASFSMEGNTVTFSYESEMKTKIIPLAQFAEFRESLESINTDIIENRIVLTKEY